MKSAFRPLPPLLAIAGSALNLIATVTIFVIPMYEGVSVTVTASGERIEQHFRKTLLEMQALEPITIVFFSAIVLLSLLAAFLAIRATRRPTRHRSEAIAIIVIGAALLFASFISGFSVGAFYLPGALLVLVAGALMNL